MKTERYEYGYFLAGSGRPACRRVTIMDRIRLWRRRRWKDDLEGLRGWVG